MPFLDLESPMCTLKLNAFSGISVVYIDQHDRQHRDERAARRMAAGLLRRRRKEGLIVTTLVRNHEWEITGPDDAATISDREGYLRLTIQAEEVDDEGV